MSFSFRQSEVDADSEKTLGQNEHLIILNRIMVGRGTTTSGQQLLRAAIAASHYVADLRN